MKYKCPICNADMVERSGRKKFYGCSNYLVYHCPGKRSLDGTPFGCESNDRNSVFYSNPPFGLNEKGEEMFEIARGEGRSYEESKEMAFAWQKWNEKDDD